MIFVLKLQSHSFFSIILKILNNSVETNIVCPEEAFDWMQIFKASQPPTGNKCQIISAILSSENRNSFIWFKRMAILFGFEIHSISSCFHNPSNKLNRSKRNIHPIALENTHSKTCIDVVGSQRHQLRGICRREWKLPFVCENPIKLHVFVIDSLIEVCGKLDLSSNKKKEYVMEIIECWNENRRRWRIRLSVSKYWYPKDIGFCVCFEKGIWNNIFLE